MNAKAILLQLKAERNRIDHAIAALEALGVNTQTTAPAAKTMHRGRRKLSVAARKRISEAAKRRWAAFRAKKA
jgi:hypothetical protein